MKTAVDVPTLAEIEETRELIRDVADITIVEHSRSLSQTYGSQVYLKCEHLQRTGSFKLRGAYSRIARLSEEERSHGVVAASAGNHAQGVAFAARALGIKATIFMPLGVPLPKLQATKAYGADVILVGEGVEDCLAAASEFAEKTGAIVIHPFDHRDVITGQATLGLEILEQVPDVDTVIVGVGGGGLISGVAAAIKQKAAELGRTIRVIGVQAENAAAVLPALEAGGPVNIGPVSTIADGIAVARTGDLTFEYIRDYVDEVVTVSDDDTAKALLLLLERAKQVVEPAGAVATAAIMSGKVKSTGGSVVSILSGGNIDPLLLQKVVEHGLTASDRYLTLSVMLPDRPGQLSLVADTVSEANANVVGVLHTRHGAGLQISEVELQLNIETQGPEHAERVIKHVESTGLSVRRIQFGH